MSYLFYDEFDLQRQKEIAERIANEQVTLRDYQLAAVDGAFERWKYDQSTLICLPTGTGKSVCFSEVMRRWDNGRVLLIAHRKELIHQAVGHANRAGLSAGVEMGASRCKGDEDVIVCSVQTLIAKTKCRSCYGEGCDDCSGTGKVRRMTGFNPMDFGLLTIDEAHHAVAESYRMVLGWFQRNAELKTLMVTATPKRTDKKGLHNVCDSVAFEMHLREAIDLGWLVPIRQKFITVSGLNLANVKTQNGDLAGGQLQTAMLGTDEEQETRLHAIAKPTLAEAAGRPTLVFASGQEHAEKLTAAFNSYPGVFAECVIDSTPPETREQSVAKFRSGELQVLVNCMVFTEGFDAPATAVVANARPTKSESLYLQMIGRGTRPLAGCVDRFESADERKASIENSAKPFCTILDFVGDSGTHKLISVGDVLAGSNVDPIDLQSALIVARDSGETVDIEALAEKMKHAREEKAKQAEVARLKRLTLNTYATAADYTAIDVDLFSGGEFDYHDGEPMASVKQCGFLKHNCGIPFGRAVKMTRRQASAAIERAKQNAAKDWVGVFGLAETVDDLRKAGESLAKRNEKLLRDRLDDLRNAYRKRRQELKQATN